MKFYKDSNNAVFAYEEDGSQDKFIPQELVAITQAEADSLRFAPQSVPVARDMQADLMAQAYAQAIAKNIKFKTAAAVSKSFQADPESIDGAQRMLAAYSSSGVPTGFYWIAADNTQVPFTLADLQGLAKAMGDQGWSAFQRLQDRKAAILAATTIEAVQAIVW